MGLFSSSSSNKSTTNNDNRVINDFANANWDNSVDGKMNNNSGSITMVDPGIMDAFSDMNGTVTSAMNNNTDLAGYSIGAARDMNADSLEFADGVVKTGFDGMQSVTSNAMELSNQSGERTLNAAMDFTDGALTQVQMGNELAMGLAQNAKEQSANTLGALGDGYEQMMQFTEQFSRSDGSELAKTNMQTVVVIAVAGVAVAYFLKGKK